MSNRCDLCDEEIGDNQGGICDRCVDVIHTERNNEWWAAS